MYFANCLSYSTSVTGIAYFQNLKFKDELDKVITSTTVKVFGRVNFTFTNSCSKYLLVEKLIVICNN